MSAAKTEVTRRAFHPRMGLAAAARRLGLTYGQAYREARDGDLDATKDGRTIRVSEAQLRAYVARRSRAS